MACANSAKTTIGSPKLRAAQLLDRHVRAGEPYCATDGFGSRVAVSSTGRFRCKDTQSCNNESTSGVRMEIGIATFQQRVGEYGVKEED